MRHGVEQAHGVGCPRAAEQLLDRRLFHLASRVHDDDALRHLRDHAEAWVIRMMAASIFCLSSRMRSRICAWMVTSRAVVGSSAISSFGLQASAMAIITRWRMPPDISCGYCCARRSGSGILTRRSMSTALAAAALASSP